MPYTKIERRPLPPENVGDLTFAITRECINFLYCRPTPLKFQDFADCVSALDWAKLELFRRLGGVYEDLKIKENGDCGYDRLLDRIAEESRSTEDCGSLKNSWTGGVR